MMTKLKLSGLLLATFLIAGCGDKSEKTSSTGGNLSAEKASLCEKGTMRVLFGKASIVETTITCDKDAQNTNMAKLESMRGSDSFLDVMPKNQVIKFDMTNVSSNVSVALLDNKYKVIERLELKPDSGVVTSNQKADYVFKGPWGLLDEIKVGDQMEVKDLIK